MAFSLRGVRLPHRKHTQDKGAVIMPTPSVVTIPMSMHIGAPSAPIVSVGDEVKIGQKIAEAGGAMSVPAYASVSGKVTKITDVLLAGGNMASAVVISSDGKNEIYEGVCAPVLTDRKSFISAVRESGVVGLGGAGFPTHFKLDVDPERIEYLVVNGAECEPYVTSDTYTMTHRTPDIATALSAIGKYLGVKRVVIGIENNKSTAIEAMKALTVEGMDIEVKVLPSVYPQGGEKVLIYNTTGKVVPVGKLPIDVGCIVINCTTLAAIGEYLHSGMPLVSKCITVDGETVSEPKCVIAPIGTAISDIFDYCGGLKCKPEKIIYGGPMMGITVPSAEFPVMKNTNALLALSEREAKLPKTTACIRCGSCTNTCPFGLAPAHILFAYNKKDAQRLQELNVTACMECGCCNYVCPANRPLVQTNKMAKIFIREEMAKEAEKK